MISFLEGRKILVGVNRSGLIYRATFSSLPDPKRNTHMTPNSPKSSLWVKMREGTVHSWNWFKHGTVLFRKNFAISRRLLRKKLNGDDLNYKEHSLLVTTTSDLVKLIPFSFFVIVPFAELLLPIVLKFYPKLLPSTYDVEKLFSKISPSKTDASHMVGSDRSKRLLAKQKLMEFFKEVSIKTDLDKEEQKMLNERNKAINDFKTMLIGYGRDGNRCVLPDISDIRNFISHFPQGPDYFRLENLKAEILESICFLLNIDPFTFRSHMVIQLKRFINEIRKEDKSIKWEGVDSLSSEDLVEANRKRGLPIEGVTPDELRNQVKEWIEISSDRNIPISVLLWIRAVAASENIELLELVPSTKQSDHDPTHETASSDTVSKLRTMSEDVIKRIADLEAFETEMDSELTVSRGKLDDKIKLVRQQIDVLNKELAFLHKLQRRRSTRTKYRN
jgi:LETM1 and EF-hand domain-containing protein 1